LKIGAVGFATDGKLTVGTDASCDWSCVRLGRTVSGNKDKLFELTRELGIKP
jgi:hypothetical protein